MDSPCCRLHPDTQNSMDSDNNPKLVHVSYDQAKGKDVGDGKAGGKLVVEKTDQVMGSCAGAGSGEFHTYRAHRRTEMHRVAAMDEAAMKEAATAKLHEAIEKSRKECNERTRKKAEKRKRKKQAKREGNAKQVKLEDTGKESSSSGTGSGGNGADSDAAEEFVYIPSADQAAAGGDGGAPAAFKNDGTFLEKMKKELSGGSEASKPSFNSSTSKAVAT